jgi:hypothetical protein
MLLIYSNEEKISKMRKYVYILNDKIPKYLVNYMFDSMGGAN